MEGQECTCLIIAMDKGYNHCWHFYKTHNQLTHILKRKRKRRRCEEEKRKRGRPKRKRDADRQANRLTEPECQGQRELEREKKVGDTDSKMSM